MLKAGAKLGPYEIQSPLGAGGMGEVYRARDTRLERIVAVKILPSHLSMNLEAKQRFDREARTISGLSHPNVCQLFDVGSHDGTSYLVMEYLEGETLADRLRKGPMPVDQVLKYAAEICDGLERAHKSGVIHRDLKPGNIMLTKSGAKLMDFGLAKPLALSAPSSLLTQTMVTPQQPLTTEGAVVGTFQYMSPEQLEGKEADVRSDIFSLGAVLYEMVTGKRAFDGPTTASTIAAVMASDPPAMSSLQPLSPMALESTVKSCLAKDPDERLQTAHDLKLQLQWIRDHASSSRAQLPIPVVPHKNHGRLGWIAAAVLLLLLVTTVAAWWLSPKPSARTLHFHSAVALAANDVALSPDGTKVALVAYSDDANKYVLWLHEIGSRTAVSLPGTEGAIHPFWSPDSRAIGFFAQGKMKKVDASPSGSAQIICDAPHGRGGTWNKDGTILYSPDFFTGLYKISLAGGSPVEVTKIDPTHFESSHRWPVFLPDGRHFLYFGGNFAGHFENNELYVGSLDSNEKRPVVSTSANAAYADPGYLIYMKDKAIVAQKFDLHNFTLSGEARTISSEVQYFPQTDLALFDAGKSVVVAQAGEGIDKNQLTWFDRTGKKVGAIGTPGAFANPKFSPDEKRLAFEQADADGRHVDIWTQDFGSGAMSRLTFGPGLNEIPVWSADGRRISFGAQITTNFTLFTKNSDGSGSSQPFVDLGVAEQGVWDWSRDGKYVLVRKFGELWYVTVSDSQPHPYLQAKFTIRNAQFSPDGKWVAYSSNENGTWEVYVSPFPNPASKWQVSRGGGDEPRWRRDGKELYYLSSDGKIIAVPVKLGASFEAGQPVTLFQAHVRQPISAQDVYSYDVTADGQRFLINIKVDSPNPAPLSVILNWSSDLEK